MVYPESFEDSSNRFESFLKTTDKLYQEEQEVIIYVSHGNIVESIYPLTGVSRDQQIIYGINYGSTTILK